jgi:endo-1,4-beta-xylanase
MKKSFNLKVAAGILLSACVILSASSCASNGSEKSSSKKNEQNQPVYEKGLYELAANYGFKMGAAYSINSFDNPKYLDMLKKDFNSVTGTNEFKAYSLLNQAASMASSNGMPVNRFERADYMMEFAQENNIGVRGHVLVWDAYMPDWFFREGYTAKGAFVNSDVMKERLAYYINDVVSHFENKFPGVIYCWDVVNEAVGDSPADYDSKDARHVRYNRSGNRNLFYDVIGPDYVEFSFKCAKEAVNAVNPSIKLYYNDYNTFFVQKRTAICELVKSINAEEKLCDGVGMQGYIGGYGSQNGCMNEGDIYSIKDAILTYAKLGVEVQITEMAVRNYDNSEAVMLRHAQFYGRLFKALCSLYQDGKNPLTAVSILARPFCFTSKRTVPSVVQ